MHENRETSSPTVSKTGSPAGKGDSRNAGMNGGEESDRAVVPMKPANQAKEQQAKAAELAEGRARTKENIGQTHTGPAQDGSVVSQGLKGVRQAARERKKERFQHRAEAERFLREFAERLAKFGLELHPDKTRLIEFGRFAQANRQARGEEKPESFAFLGFTHSCGVNRKGTLPSIGTRYGNGWKRSCGTSSRRFASVCTNRWRG